MSNSDKDKDIILDKCDDMYRNVSSDVPLEEDEEAMAAAMGFSGFSSTKVSILLLYLIA